MGDRAPQENRILHVGEAKITDELSLSTKVPAVFFARQPRSNTLTTHARRSFNEFAALLKANSVMSLAQMLSGGLIPAKRSRRLGARARRSADRPFFGQAFRLPIVYPPVDNNAWTVLVMPVSGSY